MHSTVLFWWLMVAMRFYSARQDPGFFQKPFNPWADTSIRRKPMSWGGMASMLPEAEAYRKAVSTCFLSIPEKGMASTLHQSSKQIMIERHSVKGKEVWFKIDPYPVQRANANIIPREYFTATYYFQEPLPENATGQVLKDEHGEVKLFESPVAALSFARTQLETSM